MGRSGWTNEENDITIPADATPDQPRIVITGQPPDTMGYDLDAAILFYWNATDFWYIGITTDGTPDTGYFARGFRSETLGLEDHVEEIAFSNDYPAVDWERSVVNFVDGKSSLELMWGEEYRLFVDGPYGISASDYRYTQGVDPVSLSRGTIDVGPFTAVSGFSAETVVCTLTRAIGTFSTSRRYRIEFMGRVQSTVANDRVRIRIRQTNASGTIEADCGEILLPAANTPAPVSVWCLYTGRGVLGEEIVLTVQRTAGTGTITYTPIESTVTDQAPTSLT